MRSGGVRIIGRGCHDLVGAPRLESPEGASEGWSRKGLKSGPSFAWSSHGPVCEQSVNSKVFSPDLGAFCLA